MALTTVFVVHLEDDFHTILSVWTSRELAQAEVERLHLDLQEDFQRRGDGSPDADIKELPVGGS